jgi:hypothetical protein
LFLACGFAAFANANLVNLLSRAIAVANYFSDDISPSAHSFLPILFSVNPFYSCA